MKDYVMIRLVSLIEYNLKAFISHIIDEQDVNPKRIMPYDQISINLDVLQRFKSEEYTAGRIIIAHFNRMNPKLIYQVMSRINRLDYFKWYDSIINIITMNIIFNKLIRLLKCGLKYASFNIDDE